VVWSCFLSALGLLAMWLAGSGRPAGWALAVANQVAWIAYAVVTRQYGFIAASLAYGYVFARNWSRAGKERTE
jgi:hypothetical protein